MKKNIILIGSTGTVGCSVVEVIALNKELFNVRALVAKSNYRKLAMQAEYLNCPLVILEDNNKYKELKQLNSKLEIKSGTNEILTLIKEASEDTLIVIASSNTESIKYFFEAIKSNKNIAIANKESIICAGEILNSYLKNYTKKIIPIDSEHNSLFQLIEHANYKEIKNVVITGSGGPFIDLSLEELKNIKKSDALNHPTWNMGGKITIDSATFMNKGFEVIEAAYLFNLSPELIKVVIHRQSILHAGVTYIDGTFIGNFYMPSMNIPVAYAIYYPHRLNTNHKNFNLSDIANLKFEKLNEERFISIKLAKNALKQGGNAPTILNIANEIAVAAYLQDRINFINIIDVIEFAINNISYRTFENIDDLFEEFNKIKYTVNGYINKIIN